jgi:hypothetical protein
LEEGKTSFGKYKLFLNDKFGIIPEFIRNTNYAKKEGNPDLSLQSVKEPGAKSQIIEETQTVDDAGTVDGTKAVDRTKAVVKLKLLMNLKLLMELRLLMEL